MKNAEEIKRIVRDKYAGIVNKTVSSCCGPAVDTVSSCGCGSNITDYSVFNDDYTKLDGYSADADLNLGCGLPTQHAGIKKGDTVVDLGSGAGNDVFVARSIVGDEGHVIGIDMTPAMVNKALFNNQKLGYKNVDFRMGEIEDLPVKNDEADVVISNCVLNLVPDKQKAFDEIYRILKSGAHFCISDVVVHGELSEGLKKSAEMYAGCVAGALQEEEYINTIKTSGFSNIEIKTKKTIELPDDLLKEYLDDDAVQQLKENPIGIFSITVTGTK
jgi:arsenite methyltransferase